MFSNLFSMLSTRSLRLAALAGTVFVAACSAPNVAQFASPHPNGQVQRIYVATELALNDLGPQFGKTRSEGLKYLHVDVSVPKDREPGEIVWPEGTPNAATDFVLTGSSVYHQGQDMVHKMRRESKVTGRETMVYVHGYNVTFSEASYRFAQIRQDFGAQEPGVLYTWPSAGDVRGYAYDRDSVLHSRDAFEEVLNQLTTKSDGRVVILAHSMGTQLVMETLRQAAKSGNRGMLNRINAVAFISPDIDPGVFRSQAKAIGTLPKPFVIFTSQEDRALSISSLLTGHKRRLGVIDGPEEVAGLGVKVLDFTALSDGKGLDHSVAVTSPAAISLLKGLMAQSALESPDFQDYVVFPASQ